MPSKYCIQLGKNSKETTSTKPTSVTNLQNCVQRSNFNTYITVWLQEYFHTVFKRDSAANLATFTIVKVCWVQACYCLFSPTQLWLPVVPHKAAAEVSKIGNLYIGEVGCCESGMAERSHWLTERWLELCLLEWLQWLQWSPHPQLLDAVWCTATVVVVVA